MIEIDGKTYALDVFTGLDGLASIVGKPLYEAILTDTDGTEYNAVVCEDNLTVYITGIAKSA